MDYAKIVMIIKEQISQQEKNVFQNNVNQIKYYKLMELVYDIKIITLILIKITLNILLLILLYKSS